MKFGLMKLFLWNCGAMESIGKVPGRSCSDLWLHYKQVHLIGSIVSNRVNHRHSFDRDIFRSLNTDP